MKKLVVLTVLIVVFACGSILLVRRQQEPNRLYLEARRLADDGQEDRALDALDKLIDSYPDLSQAYQSEVAIAFDMEDTNFPKYMERAKRMARNDDERSFVDGFDTLSNNEDAGYAKLHGLRVSNPDILTVLSETAIDLGRDEDAEEIADECLKIDSLSSGCRYDQLMLWVKQNRFGEVENLCKQQVKGWLEIPCALAELGLNMPGKAYERLHDATNIVENVNRYRRVTAHAWEVDCLVYQGRLKEAFDQASIVNDEAYKGKFVD